MDKKAEVIIIIPDAFYGSIAKDAGQPAADDAKCAEVY
jgi:hypothetical protein